MRVRDPLRLAELLLAEDKGWPASRVAAAAISGGPQDNQINLTRKFPVHITYFTAAVETTASSSVRRHLRPREPHRAGHRGQGAPDRPRQGGEGPVRADAVGSLAETQGGGRHKKDWVRQRVRQETGHN